MGTYLQTAGVEIYVPYRLPDETVTLIEGEGANVHKIKGSYDDAVAQAHLASGRAPNGIFVQDTAFGDYREIPNVRLRALVFTARRRDENFLIKLTLCSLVDY
jgi:hypothetical protein